MTDNDEQSIPSRGSHANILDESREWLARSRAARPLPSERIIASLLVHATLTDAERAAIREALEGAEQDARLFGDKAAAADAVALRGLLERLG